MRSICDELCNSIKSEDIEEDKIHPHSCYYSIDSVIKYLKASMLIFLIFYLDKPDELKEMYHKQTAEINVYLSIILY